MKLYIYSVDTLEIVETIEADNNTACEALALQSNWDEDLYGWTYSHANLWGRVSN